MKAHSSILVSLVVLFSLLFLPPISKADIFELPFGGFVNFSFPCTCSGMLAVWMTPLYLGGPVVVSGPITYSPYSTLLFANYAIGVPETWELGTYIPGVQACWMVIGTGCAPFTTIGLMTKVGTSLPPTE